MHSLSLLLSQVFGQGGTKSDKALDKEVFLLLFGEISLTLKKLAYDINTLLYKEPLAETLHRILCKTHALKVHDSIFS